MPRPQVIVFDLDDTLYWERDYVFSGYDAVISQLGDELGWGRGHAQRLRALYETSDRPRVFDVLLDEIGIAENQRPPLVARMIEAYRAHRPNIHLLPDAEAALNFWKPKARLGLLTDGYHRAQESKVRALGLETRFDLMVFTDRWGREYWKPHPRGFEFIQNEFRVSPDACVYVADNPAKDFVAPNRLGWGTVQVMRQEGVYRETVAPPEGAAKHIIPDLGELAEVILLT